MIFVQPQDGWVVGAHYWTPMRLGPEACNSRLGVLHKNGYRLSCLIGKFDYFSAPWQAGKQCSLENRAILDSVTAAIAAEAANNQYWKSIAICI